MCLEVWWMSKVYLSPVYVLWIGFFFLNALPPLSTYSPAGSERRNIHHIPPPLNWPRAATVYCFALPLYIVQSLTETFPCITSLRLDKTYTDLYTIPYSSTHNATKKKVECPPNVVSTYLWQEGSRREVGMGRKARGRQTASSAFNIPPIASKFSSINFCPWLANKNYQWVDLKLVQSESEAVWVGEKD